MTGRDVPAGNSPVPADHVQRWQETTAAAFRTAHPRTWTITLPPGLKMLSLNGRYHWSERDRRNKAFMKAAWAMALQAKIPRLDRVIVTAEYQPPDRRARDADNIALAAKSGIDGLVKAGVLPDDDSSHVLRVECRIGEPYPRGRLVLHVTEITGPPTGATP